MGNACAVKRGQCRRQGRKNRHCLAGLDRVTFGQKLCNAAPVNAAEDGDGQITRPVRDIKQADGVRQLDSSQGVQFAPGISRVKVVSEHLQNGSSSGLTLIGGRYPEKDFGPRADPEPTH